jgi:type I restriction-modification system DNA methylase subunit
MSSEERRINFENLIRDFKRFKDEGRLNTTSEETIRIWLNRFLEIFGWDLRDTTQVLQEIGLSRSERDVLREIGSTFTRPDYTFKLAAQKISFLDAKTLSVSIKNDREAAFQIKSYGWSILAPCAFISNFEELAIYNCTYIPTIDQDPNFGRIYLTIDEYVDNFEIIENHFAKENVYNGLLNQLYSDTLNNVRGISKITPDLSFAEQLSRFRLSLAQAIFDNNADSFGANSENLGYIVQIIINRILFIRVCEARGIEVDGLLAGYALRGFWETFKKSSYIDFYNHYDGPLFERVNSIHRLVIPDSVFEELLAYLYYPSPYRFDVIPTKLLSDIYEIFLAKKLQIVNGIVQDRLKSEYSKTRGAISTPQYLVKEVIKKTLSEVHLNSLTIDEVLDLKILDIACGSGGFLVEVLDYLEGIIRDKYLTTRPAEYNAHFIDAGGEAISNIPFRKMILDRCIFGVDIDIEAVEVAKVSLSLKVIEVSDHLGSYSEMGIYGIQILSGVGANIKCGNSLVDNDIIELYPELDDDDELIKTNPFDWDTADGFGTVFQIKQGFDYIIGNPPYVEVKNYNVDLPYMHLYLKDQFPSARNGKTDLAIPFIERAIKLLNPTGRLGFLIQKRFFKTDYGKKIREIITESNLLYSITDFESTTLFKERITYVAILVLDKTSQFSFYYKSFSATSETLPAELRSAQSPEIEQGSYTVLPSNSISDTPWVFDDIDILSLRTRLLRYGCIGDFLNIRVGIQALWDSAYHITPQSIENGIITGQSRLEESFQIELDACKPLICNINFYPLRRDNPDVYAIFPYDVDDNDVHEVLFTEFNRRFPLAGAYLNRNRRAIESEVETLPRKFPEKNNDEYWHLFTRVQNHKATYPKVLIPMTALDTFATVTLRDNYYCDNANVYFIELPEISDDNLYALSAIINSTLFSVLARSVANPQAEGYFKFNKQFLDPLPFPFDRFNRNSEMIVTRLSRLAQRISAQQQQYIIATPVQKRTLGILIRRNWNRLDELVCQLYELTSQERTIINARGRNIDRIEILS